MLGLVATLLLATATGCADAPPYDLVPVRGKVTYEDGSLIPARRITVIFVPQAEARDAKTYPSPGQAHVDVETGEFDTMTTNAYGDGATLGKNKVQVMAVGDDQSVSAAVPAIYRDPTTTPLEVEVAPEATEFELPVKKP
jgi:hypothetical protein